MSRFEALNNVDHHDLRVRLGHGAAWGDAVNLVPVFPTEFEDLQREYPVLLRRDETGGWQAVAILGLERDENLFLQGDRWNARYVPAVRRLGPFRLAFPERDGRVEPDAEPIVQVDLDHPRLARGGEGAALFRPAGGVAPYLESLTRVLRAVHIGVEAAPAMYDAFEQCGLIAPARLEITLAGGDRMHVPEVFTIDRAAVAHLAPTPLADLNGVGFLQAAYMLASSLANVSHLIDLKARAAARTAPAAA